MRRNRFDFLEIFRFVASCLLKFCPLKLESRQICLLPSELLKLKQNVNDYNVIVNLPNLKAKCLFSPKVFTSVQNKSSILAHLLNDTFGIDSYQRNL